LPTRGRKLLLLALTGLVLLPFWTAGLTGRGAPWLPWQIREVWAFTQLFAYHAHTWTSRHVQILGSDGTWHEVPHDPPFRHRPFGHQTRLDWLLLYYDSAAETPRDAERRARVLAHLCRAYARLYAPGSAAAERLPAQATPAVRARLLRYFRSSSLDAPPSSRYTPRLPGPLTRTNHDVLTECRVPRPEGPA
jgi:hypothetical protein